MVIANIFGILIFLFLFWRTLKDDYHFEKIFNLGFLTILSVLLSLLLNSFFPLNYWFWIVLISASITMLISAKRTRMKLFEIIEAFSISALPWLSFYFLEDSIKKSSLSSFLAFWTTLICIFIYFLIKSYYRSFTWYKSGRVGISGILTLLIFFLFRVVTSLFFPQVISFAGKIEPYLSGSTSLLLIFLMYNLSINKE